MSGMRKCDIKKSYLDREKELEPTRNEVSNVHVIILKDYISRSQAPLFFAITGIFKYINCKL